MEKKRPVGVTIVGILMLFYTILEAAFLVYDYKTLLYLSGWFLLILFCICISAIIYLVSGIGILNLKNWARKLFIYFSILLSLLFVLDAIGNIISGGDPYFTVPFFIELWVTLPILPSLIFLIYLTRSKVKEQFN